MYRRDVLKLVGAGLMAWNTRLVYAADSQRPRIIWVLLRGGMDSLHAVIPHGDDDLMRQRPGLVTAVKEPPLDLGQGFALHPELGELYQLYRARQMAPIIATASGTHIRSHFKAQDLLECGLDDVDYDSGWLNRALAGYRGEGLAVAHSIPISLRGQRAAKTWYPDSLPAASDDLYQRLGMLYESEDSLKARLEEGLDTREKLGMENSGRKTNRKFAVLAQACAKLMAQADGPDCAMLEMGGWDTHSNAASRLARQFAQLDLGIANLRQRLGRHWEQTVVIVASEFGRTVAENGTKGTDHGTAGAMFLAGGAVRGGQVFGSWPGLAKRDQFDGRDLMPTSDIREWLGAVLHQHWRLNDVQLSEVFPGVEPASQTLVRVAT